MQPFFGRGSVDEVAFAQGVVPHRFRCRRGRRAPHREREPRLDHRLVEKVRSGAKFNGVINGPSVRPCRISVPNKRRRAPQSRR